MLFRKSNYFSVQGLCRLWLVLLSDYPSEHLAPFRAHVPCDPIFDHNLADLLYFASQPPVNCWTVITPYKLLKIFNGFIGFCGFLFDWISDHVHIILTAQKTSMPLTWEQNTLFFYCQHAIHFCCKLLDLVGNTILMQCSKFTIPARRINMSYTNDCNKYNIYPFYTGKHFLVKGETHNVSLWRGSTAHQIFSLISFVPYLVRGLNGNRNEQSQHLMHLQTPNPYSHLHGFRFTDWARYSNLTDMSSYNPWHVECWFMRKYNSGQSSYSWMCTWKQLYYNMNRSSKKMLKCLNLKMTPVLHQTGNITFTPQSKAIKKFDVHHIGKADSLLHWHTSQRNFWVRISASSRTRCVRRSTFVIRRLQHIIRLKQGGVEIKISQPFVSESCKHSKDKTEVMKGLLSTQWSLTFTYHRKETGNLNSTLYRSKLHLESHFQEEYLSSLFSHPICLFCWHFSFYRWAVSDHTISQAGTVCSHHHL